jgi:hypothetical protein
MDWITGNDVSPIINGTMAVWHNRGLKSEEVLPLENLQKDRHGGWCGRPQSACILSFTAVPLGQFYKQ